jgi:diguanylate cyclase (GGDEF)-like protein/PAS domain S-box-containing protein
MKTLSLKTRFAIGMSIGALALVIGMGAISMYCAQEDLMATLSSQQLGLAEREANDLDEWLKLASDSLAGAAIAMPPEAIASAESFRAFQRQHPMLLELFDDLLVVDVKLTVIADYPAREGRIGLDLSDRRYLQRAMALKSTVISEPVIAKVSRLPVISMAAPILDQDGNLTALLLGVSKLTRQNFLGGLSNEKIGKTGYFTVVATWPEPQYLAHPDPSRLMQKVEAEKNPAMAEVLNATTASVTTSKLEDGSEVLISSAPLKVTNWVLAAILPRAEAFAAIDQSRNRTIRIGLVAAAIVLPLVWLFAWMLLRSLGVLQRELLQIARDPGGTRFATITSRDEVGQVAQAFNAMLVEQRQSEALRIASDQDRRRLVAILESSQDFVAMTDIHGHLTYLNASGRLRRGVGLNEDLSHTTIRDHFPQWALDKLTDEGIPLALRDGIWLGETAVLDADGNEVPVDQTVIAHRNVDGALEFFSSLMHDTSVAKATSAAMRSSEARMLSIADALPVLVSFIDREYRYRFVNSRYEEHFGIARALIIGKSIAELIGETAFQFYLPHLERAARGETQVFELESRSGLRPVHFLVKLIPQFDDDRALTGFHFIHQDVTDHKAENRRLLQLAHADALTGLLNRAGFEIAIEEAMQRSRSHLSAMALLYLDVDRFKSVNDQHGHLIGDALLRAFAQRLLRALRSADTAARLGGDEFVVIAEGLRNIDDVRAIAKKILRTMRPTFELDGLSLTITATVGIAAFTGDAMRSEELIRRADTALYRAKNAGRDRYDLDDPSQAVIPSSFESGQALELGSLI